MEHIVFLRLEFHTDFVGIHFENKIIKIRIIIIIIIINKSSNSHEPYISAAVLKLTLHRSRAQCHQQPPVLQMHWQY